MYANLKVTTTKGKTLSAWKVEVERDRVVVYLDSQDGTGNYAEEAGQLVLHPGDEWIKVEASW